MKKPKFTKIQLVKILESNRMKILVTGFSGFVGSALCETLVEAGYYVKASARMQPSFLAHPNIEFCQSQEIDQTNWLPIMRDVDVVIHLAAHVHQMKSASSSEAEYHRVNVLGTDKILKAALASGVKRFVFLSSIKVNGEESSFSGFTESDAPAPQDAYARSKWQAEQLISEQTKGSNLEFVVVRTPLVYGKGVKANFAHLFKWVSLGLPLPLGLVCNQRSFIYIDNLVSALLLVSTHPAAKGKTYLVSDAETVSTAELIQEIARALGRRAYLLPVPPVFLKGFAKCIGKQAIAQRLLGDLVVDTSLIKRELGWLPPYSLREGLQKVLDRQ